MLGRRGGGGLLDKGEREGRTDVDPIKTILSRERLDRLSEIDPTFRGADEFAEIYPSVPPCERTLCENARAPVAAGTAFAPPIVNEAVTLCEFYISKFSTERKC